MNEQLKAKIMNVPKSKKWYEDYYFDDEFIYRDTFGNHTPYKSLLNNALNKPIGTPYDFTDGFFEGEKRGFGEGAETSIKSFVTGGEPKIFVSGDKIIPFSNNGELLQNHEIRPLIKEFTKTKNTPKEIHQLESDLINLKQDKTNKKNNYWNQPIQAEEDFNTFLESFNNFNNSKPLEPQLIEHIKDLELKVITNVKNKLVPEMKSPQKKALRAEEYDGPVDDAYLQKIIDVKKGYKESMKTHRKLYHPKVVETRKLKKEIKELIELKTMTNDYQKEIKEEKEKRELEKKSYKEMKTNLKNKLLNEKTKYDNRADSSWVNEFLKDKNGQNAIYTTPTFSTYNLKNIQDMFPLPNNISVHDRIEKIKNTELTDENLTRIKNYSNKNIESKNIFDFITVPGQTLVHPLEDLINKRYPNLNQMEKLAMEKYIKDKKTIHNKK